MNFQELECLKNKFIYKPIEPSKRRVNFFDPSVAPALTAPSYYEIESPQKDIIRNQQMQNADYQFMN